MSTPIELKENALKHTLYAIVQECEGVKTVKQVSFRDVDGHATLAIDVTIAMGTIIPSFALATQRYIIERMESLLQIHVHRVNISISSIT